MDFPFSFLFFIDIIFFILFYFSFWKVDHPLFLFFWGGFKVRFLGSSYILEIKAMRERQTKGETSKNGKDNHYKGRTIRKGDT